MVTEEIPEELRVFLLEAYEIVDALERELVELEKNPQNKETINKIFRGLHTLKGNSGFLGLQKLESFCHKTETVLDRMRNGILSSSPQLITLLLRAVDFVRENLTSLENTGKESADQSTDTIEKLQQFLQ